MTQHLLVRLLFLHLFLHNPQMLGPGDLSTCPKAAQNKVLLSGMQHLNKDKTTTATQKGIGVISQWTAQTSP